MVEFISSCRSCGDVLLASGSVSLFAGHGWDAPFYTFRCPVCSSPAALPASSEVLSGLLEGGVTPVEAPAELFEDRTGPPLDEAHVEAFRSLLADEERLRSLLPRS